MTIKFLIISLIIFIASCGSKKDSAKQAESKEQKLHEKYGLTEFQLVNGIGPVKAKMTISENIDAEMVKKGKDVFDMKCIACHMPDKRFVGPSVRYVTDRRTVEYVMNMILNPDEMVNKHPIAKEMLKKYMNKMTFQNVSFAEARELMEYLRSLAAEGHKDSIKETETFPSLNDIK
jgi:cytochrome c